MAFPAYEYAPPKETPPVGGLLTVANVVTVPPPVRILGGVKVEDSIDHTIYESTFEKVGVCWADAPSVSPGPGLFPYGAKVFDPYLLEVPVQCDPTVTDEELTATATHVHEFRRHIAAETALYETILPGMKPTPDTSFAVEQVLATADHQTAAGYGTRVVHLAALWATYLLGKGVIVKSGTIYRTAMGNPIVFTGVLADVDAYITSPVTILQTAMEVRPVLDHQNNDRFVTTSQILVPVLHSTFNTNRFRITTTSEFPDGNAPTTPVTP